MRKWSVILLVLLVVASVIAGSSNATRKPVRPVDLVTGKLTVEHGTGILPQVLTIRTLMGNTCDIVPIWNRYTYKTRVGGIMLWRYSQQVYACFVGGSVTYFQRFRFFEIPDLVPGFGLNPWKWKGNVDNSCETEHCTWSGQADSKFAMTRGWFEACAVPLVNWVCNDVYPLLTITVYGNGTYDQTARQS